jgi:hypothetical protein
VVEVKKGFGTGVLVLEPIGRRDVSVARHGVLENFRELALSVEEDVPHPLI